MTCSMHNSFKPEKIKCQKPLEAHKMQTTWKHRVMHIECHPGPRQRCKVLKWCTCLMFPIISSWLTGTGGGGEPKSALMCSEALANHTWPLPSTHANEWWPLGTTCCSALLKSQLQHALVLDINTDTPVWRHTASRWMHNQLKDVLIKSDNSLCFTSSLQSLVNKCN